MRIRTLQKLFVLTLVLLLVVVVHVVSAQVMQSTNYSIESDSINVGGVFSTSTSYQLEDTAGEIATGKSSSASYVLRAGYQQMQEVFLSLTSAVDVTMSPSIGGVTGGTSNGSTVATATTDSRAGYQLSIQASSSPALESGVNTIADYVPGGDPDFTFTTGATDSHFGFSPEGTDIVTKFKDDGSACNTGSSDASLSCWDGLSTSNTAIASRSSGNHPDGTATTIRFRVGIGGSANQVEGTYTATTTLTLVSL